MRSRLRRAAPSIAGPLTVSGLVLSVLAQNETVGGRIAGLMALSVLGVAIVVAIAKPPRAPEPVDWRVAGGFTGASFCLAVGGWLGVADDGQLLSWIEAMIWPLVTSGWGYYAVRRRRRVRRPTETGAGSAADLPADPAGSVGRRPTAACPEQH